MKSLSHLYYLVIRMLFPEVSLVGLSDFFLNLVYLVDTRLQVKITDLWHDVIE